LHHFVPSGSVKFPLFLVVKIADHKLFPEVYTSMKML
jgi:hypothetical protein